MRKFLLFVALTAAVCACVPRYRIMVSEPDAASRPFYTPMIKTRTVHYAIPYWREGTPVLEQNEAMLQIHRWKIEQAHIKRARKPRYIRIKRED